MEAKTPSDAGNGVPKNDTPARAFARELLGRHLARMKQMNTLHYPLSASVVRETKFATVEDLVAIGRSEPKFPVVFHVGAGGHLSMEQFDGVVKQGAF